MKTRLYILNPNFVQKLLHLDEQKLKKISNAVCNFALERNNIKAPLVLRGLEFLKGTTLDDRASLKIQLENLLAKLDDIQWNLHEQVDLGTESTENYILAFCNARAVNALLYALDEDPYVAAAESIYEANAATNNLQALEDVINKALLE
ncbi:MAG: hypothetical protein CVU39_26780 [Chloroflexi bacterium HGW-Chloroflexi-10]|nr:MAG: hypothetical protein CVU39_26780 [Chloroflexi bacterium HGW-Chloroflexi-10]